MQTMLDELRAGSSCEVQAVVANLIDVLVEEHGKITAENADLSARVDRLEAALLGISGATSIIDDRPAG